MPQRILRDNLARRLHQALSLDLKTPEPFDGEALQGVERSAQAGRRAGPPGPTGSSTSGTRGRSSGPHRRAAPPGDRSPAAGAAGARRCSTAGRSDRGQPGPVPGRSWRWVAGARKPRRCATWGRHRDLRPATTPCAKDRSPYRLVHGWLSPLLSPPALIPQLRRGARTPPRWIRRRPERRPRHQRRPRR